MSGNIEGLKELNKAFKDIRTQTRKELDKIITDIALDLASKSSQSAPVLYGDLRGELAVPKKIPKGYKIGSSLPYTRRQHESLEYSHPRGGGAKFLEKPFNENKDKYLKAVEEVIKNVNK